MEAHADLEAGLTAAVHAARAAVTSALWEFNYPASQRAAQISCTKQAINEYKEAAARLACVMSSLMDPAPRIAANPASFTVYLSSKVL